MNKSEGLIKITPKLGKAILGEAEESLIRIRKDKVLETVRGIMWRKQEALKRVEEAKADAEKADSELRAIEDGDFEIDPRSGEIRICGKPASKMFPRAL